MENDEGGRIAIKMRTEDGYIISKCLNGEPEAFGLLVDKYKASIFAFTYFRLRNFHDAEDVTQEVFIQAYRKLRALRQYDSFLAWLYSIASDRCRKLIRSRAPRPDNEFIADQEPKVLENLSLDSYRNGIVSESLRESLDSLPEIYREALTLHYLGGMSAEEIARFLGASPTAIRQQLNRARKQLKEEILDMMSKTYKQQKLQAIFTFRIVEAIKHIRIDPAPRMTGLPFGLSSAVGIILTVLCLNPHFSVLNPKDFPIVSDFPNETTVMETGEIPVDVLQVSDMLRISRISLIYGNHGRGDGGEPGFPVQQNALLMAPGGEGDKFPEKPSARFGKGTVEQVAYSPDGKLLAVAGGIGIWLYDANNLNEIGLLEGHTGVVECIAFSPDGKTLVSGSQDNTIRLWDVAGKNQMGLLEGHTEWVQSVAFSPGGKTLASGSWDKTVRLWDVAGQKQSGLLQGHTGEVQSVTFSPDGKILASGSNDKTVRLWDVAGRKQMGLLQGHTDQVSSVAFSPDGKTLASGGADRTIRLWDVDGQNQVGLLQGHTGGVFSVAFSPYGKWLASGSEDGTVLLWEVNLPVPSGKSIEPKGKRPMMWGEVKRTAFYQNFPNPFNPETWIPFSLSEQRRVNIRIYSSTGQFIRTLNLGQKPAGEYLNREKAAHWDGRNDNGELVASGVYFYTMGAGGLMGLRKMVVVR